MHEKFLKPYDPLATEGAIYKRWEDSGFFNPDNLPLRQAQGKPFDDAQGKPYTIIMPPPNVTGVLHMGHALMLTIEDILIRYKRMRGYKTLWLPGTDHAAIATQSKVEKDLSKEGTTRSKLGREEFLKRVRAFAAESHDTIVKQIRTMGASCDWSREAYTLDEKRTAAVNTMFKMMHDDGLIYRGNRIVNWDPKGQTTISDDEIVYEERDAKFYTFKYSKDFPLRISTTRPETKVGDTAVAVHPDDPRYAKFVGKEYDVVFCDVPLHIKIVADKSVEKEFGTGALGVTPAHSQTDWDIAERHGLPRPQVINEYAKMTVGGRLEGKKTLEARELIVAWLKEEGLLEKEEDIKQNISTAERTGGIVEPLPKLQWFINVNKPVPSRGNKTLKELMREPVADGRIAILPDHFSKIYFHWIDNLRDWCISRQIWFGHRVPVWYLKDSSGTVIDTIVGIDGPSSAEASEGTWEQDEDTLDTWFSSGLWTFSTLGWPDKTADLATYHPTDVLETGHEILFFWIARMVLMSQYALGDIPFRTVYLHGTVRDQKGRKMSKSLGNGIDPTDVAKEFGTDAGRMALVVGNTPGTDMKIWKDKIKGYKNFANKLWNVTRFVLSSTESLPWRVAPLSSADAELAQELRALADDVTKDMEEYRLYLAAEKLYRYLWHRFADVILEESKPIFLGDDEAAKHSRARLLQETLRTLLKLLHPFTPFITEEIWGELSENGGLLMVAPWPVSK